MTADAIIMEITAIEEFHLARLVDDFIELVHETESEGDPALERLTPTPYPDDSEAAAEFADATRADLLDRRVTDARRVRASLGEFPAGIGTLAGDAALDGREVLIPLDNVDAWLRTLTAIRLVIATRLGITSDEQVDEDGRLGVYEWIGYRLELIIQAADEADTA